MADGGKMAELEKFKRRLVRTVARLRQQNKPEEELWEQLQKNTKCDCKWMWNRMRTLTLKRLKRLLLAVDKQDNITAVARMTLTDWMMFDFILVHEDIDLTGTDLNLKSEPLCLLELFSLVQRFGVEGRSGNELACAWTAATVHYNSQGRQCSPMLLQRRWYQMKKLTRETFYKFWFTYRGNPKYLGDARAQHAPSILQSAIAKRYPHIITKPFIPWPELIERRLAILPEEFEVKLRSLNDPSDLPKPCDENSPDVLIVEPEIEVVDLRVDSESETEYDERDIVNEGNKLLSTADKDGDSLDSSSAVTQSDIPKSSTSLITNVKVEPEETNTDDLDELSDCDDLATTIIPSDTISNNIEISKTFSAQEQAIKCSTDYPALNDSVESASDPTDAPEPIVMPLITNVFGNVHIENDALVEISNALKLNSDKLKDPTEVLKKRVETKVTKSVEQVKIVDDNEVEEIDLEGDIISNIHVSQSMNTPVTKDNLTESNVDLQNMPANITLMDDGIEFVDDGIVLLDCEDTDVETKPNLAIKTEDIKTESDIEENEETPKFDLKLLMEPVVYTTKLDDMKYFKTNDFANVKHLININDIIVESKPVSIRSVGNSDKQKANVDKPSCNIEDNYINDDLLDNASITSESSECENDKIPENMKLSMSSGLFQKPRTRNYTFINLCKNPDFNTRLKRLTVGFLSSTRNRQLLKACKPLTIDVNKIFESKLVNETMYLKSQSLPNVVKTVTSDVVEESSTSGEQTTTVLPSAMSVQSLIDNTKMNMADLLPVTKDINEQPTQDINKDIHDLCERKKIINLPDIENVRRINQKLLIAEVTPIQSRIQNDRGVTPPVQIVPQDGSSNIKFQEKSKSDKSISFVSQSENKASSMEMSHSYARKNISSNKLQRKPNDSKSVTECTYRKDTNFNVNKKVKQMDKNVAPWMPRFATSVSWLGKEATKVKEGESLLTVDTLYKMLTLISPDRQIQTTKKATKKEVKALNKALKFQTLELQKNLDEFERMSNGLLSDLHEEKNNLVKKDGDNDCQTSASKSSKLEKTTNSELPMKKKPLKINIISATPVVNSNKYCCWARAKINEIDEKLMPKHRHPLSLCTCCCKKDLDIFSKTGTFSPSTDPVILVKDEHSDIQKACNTIEIGVQVTQKLSSDTNINKTINLYKTNVQNIIKQHVAIKTASTAENSHTNIKSRQKISGTEELNFITIANGSININSNNKEAILPVVQNTCKDNSESITLLPNIIDVDNDITDNSVDQESVETKSNYTPINVLSGPDELISTVTTTKACININTNKETIVPMVQNVYKETSDPTLLPTIIDVDNDITNNSVDQESGQSESNYAPHNVSRVLINTSQVSFNITSDNITEVNASESPCLTVTNSPNKSTISGYEQNSNRMYNKRTRMPYTKQIVVDGTGGLKPHTKKVLSLNSKHVEAPIYLGKNKILLTDVNMHDAPTNINKIATSENKPSIAYNRVQTVLLAEGAEMTYVDMQPVELLNKQRPSMCLDVDKTIPTNVIDIANLKILNDVVAPVISYTQNINEIVPVSNDENTGVQINNNELKEQTVVIEEKSNAIESVNSINSCELLKTTDNEISNTESNIISSNKEIDTSLVSDLYSENTKELSTDNSSIAQENEVDVSNIKVVNSENSKENTMHEDNKKKIIENEADSLGTETIDLALPNSNKMSEDPKPEEVEYNTSIQRKSILSDLMEMSGISTEDAKPMPNDITHESGELLHNVDPYVSHPYVMHHQLYPVKSFTELKYACEKNGKFFKCDLDTGLITTINVCIKKNPKESELPLLAPKNKKSESVIDLTDDKDDTSEIQPQVKIPSNKLEVCKQKFKKISTANISEGIKVMSMKTNAKPIKLFKVSYPSILKKKVDVNLLNKKILNVKSLNIKRKRKQHLFESESTSFQEIISSEGKLQEEDSSSHDDDSDDEPLAKKFKRLRQEKSINDSTSVDNEVVSVCTENISSDFVNDISNESAENRVEPHFSTPLAIMSDIDMPEEDSILGV
ncbi:uncharacterized protein LOC131849838 [Achroia grisella]|uniref:uncharacterized protein LOC131849838 n=1 Tax=Achroia grisella TaxID=688607 RepID=UPI0027D26B24|nr:uncharacterized protein LOC131849838 [Achroia grisella]